MKLDRSHFVVLAVLTMTGCAARPSGTPVATAAPVSAAQLTSAELRAEDDAPKVGKSQRSDSSVVDDEEGKHERVSHGGLDRKRGGFSGYK